MTKFRVSGQKTNGSAAYSFNYPHLSKEEACRIAVDKERHGFNCTVKKDE